MNEIWEPIAGYPDYQASTLGNVRSLKHAKERIRKVNFVSVHRLVAEAFIPNPEGKAQVNHRASIKG